MQFEGIYTPVVTPYFEDFSLNHEGLAKTIDHLINAGVHGLIIAGTTGEYYAQSTEERRSHRPVAPEPEARWHGSFCRWPVDLSWPSLGFVADPWACVVYTPCGVGVVRRKEAGRRV